jgi:hypothetical protein
MEELANYESPREIQGEFVETPPTINDLIFQMVNGQVSSAVTEQMALLKERVSDVVAASLDAYKSDVMACAIAREVGTAVAEAKVAANMETLQKIQTQYNRAEAMSAIDNLVIENRVIRNNINSKRTTLRTVRQSLADVDLAVKEAEAALLADIMAETLSNSDKPKFSNDKARQAELMARKKVDADYLSAAQQYKAVREQVEALEDELSSLDAELKTAEMQFHAECKSLESMTAEMNIYAAALGVGAYSGWIHGTTELAEVELGPVRECRCAKPTPAKPEQIGQVNQENINSEPTGW